MALQGVTIELDDNVMPVYDTPYLAENAYEFLSEACLELKEDSEVVKASFTAGDDIKNGNYLGALNGLIMTVHEAFTHNRHLILDPYVFRVAVQIQLAARQYGEQSEYEKQKDHGYVAYFEDKLKPDNYEAVAKVVVSRLVKNSRKNFWPTWETLLEMASTDFGYASMEYVPLPTDTLIEEVLERPMKPSENESLLDPVDKEPSDLFRHGSIPSVTLLGRKADWEDLTQMDFFKDEDVEGKDLLQYRKALRSLFDHFAMSFDNPRSDKLQIFWKAMCPTKAMNGWLAVFNNWDAYGKENGIWDNGFGFCVGKIKDGHVSPGYRLIDYRVDHHSGTVPPSEPLMLGAGIVGMQFSSSKPEGHKREDTVRPLGACFMVLHKK